KTAVSFIPTNGLPTHLTYGELQRAVERTAVYLQSLGVKEGNCVAVQIKKCTPFILLNLAIMRLGAFVLPLNPTYPDRELTFFLQNSQAMLFFTDELPATAIRELVQTIRVERDTAVFLSTLPHDKTAVLPPLPIDPERTALMIYTSGTTGLPKGAEITHRNLAVNLDGLQTIWSWQADDILLHVLPIFHIHGLLVALYGALYAGATTLLTEKFDAEQTLTLLDSEKCTILMGVPSIHKRLVDVPDLERFDLSHMRIITSGSDRLPDDLFNQFKASFGHTLLERYGMTETGITLSNPLNGERRIGSVGTPLPNVKIRIADPASDAPLPNDTVGELQIKGPHLFNGYWQLPQKTKDSYSADGWFKTGDFAIREEDGYVTLKGRLKDLVISGGLNVYPPEVELVLADHPDVLTSAVIGCPNEEWGEQVTAVIVPKPNANLTETEIMTHCRTHLAPYKLPRKIIFVDSLPANALGKVQKSQLRENLCQDETS
ncbi:MAG: AMP-binding protein, partial [Chloroflexota bacterium]